MNKIGYCEISTKRVANDGPETEFIFLSQCCLTAAVTSVSWSQTKVPSKHLEIGSELVFTPSSSPEIGLEMFSAYIG